MCIFLGVKRPIQTLAEKAERNKRIAAEFAAGVPARVLAEANLTSVGRIFQITKSMGITPPDRSQKADLATMCAEGKTEEEMAHALGVTKLAIHKRLWKMGLKAHKNEPTRWEDLAKNFEFSSGCWIWKGSMNAYGYGRYRKMSKTKLTSLMAHRAVYEQLVGPIPDHLELDHLCRERACVNPGHLEPVDHQENCIRGLRGPRDSCPKGHPFKGENLYAYGTTKLCRICRKEAMARFFAKKGTRKNAKSA